MRELTVSVWDARTTINAWDGIDGPIDFVWVDVPLDQAADLADDLAGGPIIAVTPSDRRGSIITGWTLRARGFIEVDAYEAIYASADLLRGHLPAGMTTYRLADGKLTALALE